MDVNEVGDIMDGGGPDGEGPEKLGDDVIDPGGNAKGDESIVCVNGPTAGSGGARGDEGVKVEIGGGGPIGMSMLEFVLIKFKLVVCGVLIIGEGGKALEDGEVKLVVMGDEFNCGTKPGGTKVEAVVENVETEEAG